MVSEHLRQAVCAEVARMLKAERVKRKLSMTDLAAQCGLSHQMVSFVEREMRNPTLDTLLRITGALGVSLPDVLKRATRAAATQKRTKTAS